MGGSIRLESEDGKGSTFSVEIPNVPVLDTEVTVEQKVFDTSTIVFEPATILIVDDNEENRKLIIDLLAHSSLTILQAENGKEAVEMANKFLPDVIIMDLRMPVMDGYDAGRLLSIDKLTESIPIIALSASIPQSNDNDRKSLEEIFDAYLLKPLDINLFFEKLKKHLNYENVKTNMNLPTPSKEKQDYKLSEGLIQKLPELLKTLESEFIPEYNKTMKNQVINDIEKFGLTLLSFSKEMQCEILIDLSNEIILHADNFDFEKLIQTLKKFPELVTWLKTQVKSN